MPTYELITLVDITRSQPKRTDTDKLRLAQQANFNTLCQAIGLRSNFEYYQNPIEETGSLPHDIGGKATYWKWTFITERDDTFLEGNDHTSLLRKDLHCVPVINDLNNSVDIDPAVFSTEGKNVNTWVYKLSELE